MFNLEKVLGLTQNKNCLHQRIVLSVTFKQKYWYKNVLSKLDCKLFTITDDIGVQHHLKHGKKIDQIERLHYAQYVSASALKIVPSEMKVIIDMWKSL